MGPKLGAANAFASATGKPASIGRLEDATQIAQRLAGTTIDVSFEEMCLRT